VQFCCCSSHWENSGSWLPKPDHSWMLNTLSTRANRNQNYGCCSSSGGTCHSHVLCMSSLHHQPMLSSDILRMPYRMRSIMLAYTQLACMGAIIWRHIGYTRRFDMCGLLMASTPCRCTPRVQQVPQDAGGMERHCPSAAWCRLSDSVYGLLDV